MCILAGCRTSSQRVSSLDQLAAFSQLGPGLPTVDLDKIVKARLPKGSHRVVPDEVVSISMPAILSVVTAEEAPRFREEKPILCRVNELGTIALPVIGEIPVAGLTLPEIEALIVNTYYPKYTKNYPAVYTEIVEKKVYRVSITGAVKLPGLYKLPYDEMSLVAVLMQAGGINEDGAASIRILRSQTSETPGSGVTYTPSTYSPNDKTQSVLSLASFPIPARGLPESKLTNDIQIAFQPQGQARTAGILMIRRNDRELFRQPLDLSDRLSRKTMLRELMRQSDDLDVTAVNQQLLSLLAILQSDGPSTVYPHTAFSADETMSHQVQYASLAPSNPGMVRTAGMQTKAAPFDSQQDNEEMIVLPVKNLNIPFADVALHEGDSVIVEKLQIPMFTVLGLVTQPGNYEYPQHEDYNLMEAIGFASGPDPDLEPHYATIYRLDQDGEIHHVRVNIKKSANKEGIPSGMSIHIKPGDIVALEHTSRTRTKKFLLDTFRLNMGIYANPNLFN